MIARTGEASLPSPIQGEPRQQVLKLQFHRLPSIEDRLDNVRREQGEPKDAADVGRPHVFGPPPASHTRRCPASSATGTPAPVPSPSRCRPAAAASTRPHPSVVAARALILTGDRRLNSTIFAAELTLEDDLGVGTRATELSAREDRRQDRPVAGHEDLARFRLRGAGRCWRRIDGSVRFKQHLCPHAKAHRSRPDQNSASKRPCGTGDQPPAGADDTSRQVRNLTSTSCGMRSNSTYGGRPALRSGRDCTARGCRSYDNG